MRFDDPFMPGRRIAAAVAALCVLLLTAHTPLHAHQVLHRVQTGGATVVKVYENDGVEIAGAVYEVFSPRDLKTPHQKGHTDRHGYLSFVPDAPGGWRVRVVGEDGHGIDVTVEAGASSGGEPPSQAWIRPLAGVAVIGAIFAAIWLLGRWRTAGR